MHPRICSQATSNLKGDEKGQLSQENLVIQGGSCTRFVANTRVDAVLLLETREVYQLTKTTRTTGSELADQNYQDHRQ